MNIREFDALILEIAELFKVFTVKREKNDPELIIIKNDLNNLISSYTIVRSYLILSGIDKSKSVRIQAEDYFHHLISKLNPPRNKTTNLAEISGKLKRAAIDLNIFIATTATKSLELEKDIDKLSSALYLPVILLHSKYRKLISSLLFELQTWKLPVHLSIVGSQALALLLTTLTKDQTQAGKFYNILTSRDLDLRINLPENISDQRFLLYCNFMKDLLTKSFRNFNENSSLAHKYYTFTHKQDNFNFDVVLTCRETIFANCSIKIPLTRYQDNIFIPYRVLHTLSNQTINIYDLEAHVTNRNIYALAFAMKLLHLGQVLHLRLDQDQQQIWDNIEPQLMSFIRAEYSRKYLQVAIAEPMLIRPQHTAPGFTEIDFPLLSTRYSAKQESKKEEPSAPTSKPNSV